MQVTDDAVVDIYLVVDEALQSGYFGLVDELLSRVRIDRQPVVMLLAYASITYAAKEKLYCRDAYMRLLRERLARERGAEACDNLLRDLE